MKILLQKKWVMKSSVNVALVHLTTNVVSDDVLKKE